MSRTVASRRTDRGLGALAILALGHLAIDAYSSGYAPLLPPLRDRLGLTLTQIGWCTGVLTLSSSLLQPLYGWLSDRLRVRWILALAPLVAGLGLGAMSGVESYGAALAALFVAGIGIAAYHPQSSAQVRDVSSRRPGLFMAIFIAAGSLGFSAGPFLMATAYETWGWGGLWRVAIPGALATGLLAWRAPRPAPRADGEDSRSLRAALGAHRRPLVLLYLLVVIRGIVQLSFTGFLTLYWVDLGLPFDRASLFLTVFLACGALGGFLGGYLTDLVGGTTVIRLAMAGSMPLFLLGTTLATGRGWLQVLVLGAAVGFILLTMPVNVLLAQEFVPGHRSTISSLMMGFAWGVGGVVAPLVGAAGDLFGLGWALLAVGCLPGLGLALAWRLPEPPAGSRLGARTPAPEPSPGDLASG